MISLRPVHLYAIFIYAINIARSLKLPSDMGQDLYCAGCEAVIEELDKKLSKKSTDSVEVRVIDVMENICEAENFRAYDYIPPKMVKSCKYLLEQYDEDIEQALITHYRHSSHDDLKKSICYGLTHACVGLNRDKAKKNPDNLKVEVDREDQEFEIKIPEDAKVASPSNMAKDSKVKTEL